MSTARPRAVYLYHVVDNADSMARDGCQAVAWQTAINPVVALELLATGTWSGAGVLGPEAFDAVPFLELLAEYGAPARHRGAHARTRPVGSRFGRPRARGHPRRGSRDAGRQVAGGSASLSPRGVARTAAIFAGGRCDHATRG